MQCARTCQKQDESLDPFSVSSTHLSVLCRHPRKDCLRAGTNGRVTEAQQQGRIGRQAWACDELSSQRVWVLGCRRLDWCLFVHLPFLLTLTDSVPLEGHNTVWNLTSWECPQNDQQIFSSQERGWNRRAGWESFALQCHLLYNHKRKSRKPTAWGKKKEEALETRFLSLGTCVYLHCVAEHKLVQLQNNPFHNLPVRKSYWSSSPQFCLV